MRGILTGGKTSEPQIPTPEVLRKILVELGPFYVKLGQLLSTRPDLLSPDYIQALTALQANVPPVDWEAIEAIIKQQLKKPLEEVFTVINPTPIAAGSIAQIHRATLKDGREAAIKVQRPGIDKIVAQDIILIKGIAELVSLTDFGQTYDVVKLAEEFTQAVKDELNFTLEATYTDKLRQNLAQSRWFDSQDLTIPKIYWDITTEKLLAMEWLEGKPLLDAVIFPAKEGQLISDRKKEITTLLFRAFFQQMYLDGFFHADPHPGNIFYLQDGKVALIDFGMMGCLDPRTQQILTEMLLAIVDLDARACSQLTLELSESVESISLARLTADYERMLRKYYNLNLAQVNFSEVVYQLLQIARNNKIQVPGSLGLYAKSLANLEGLANH
jgi:ubiquinone biosynthesis protein